MIEPLNGFKQGNKISFIFQNGTAMAVLWTVGDLNRSGEVNACGAAIIQVCADTGNNAAETVEGYGIYLRVNKIG